MLQAQWLQALHHTDRYEQLKRVTYVQGNGSGAKGGKGTPTGHRPSNRYELENIKFLIFHVHTCFELQ